jgi:hypothetical protein
VEVELWREVAIVVGVLAWLEPIDELAPAFSGPEIVGLSLGWPVDAGFCGAQVVRAVPDCCRGRGYCETRSIVGGSLQLDCTNVIKRRRKM